MAPSKTEHLTRAEAETWLTSGAPSISDAKSRFGLDGDLLANFRSSKGSQQSPSPEQWYDGYMARTQFVQEISFAVPCAEAISLIASHGPVLEGGAGTGFWAALLSNCGCDILACDFPAGQQYGQPIGRYHPIVPITAEEAVQLHSDRNLLLVWPSYGEEWATDAVRNLLPGRFLSLVSENRGMAVAANSLFDLIERDFEPITEIEIPQWPGIHDFLSVHRKIR